MGMRLLPLVQRELLVAARWNGTYRVRWAGGAAALLTWFAILYVCQNNPGRQGPILLRCLAGLGFAFAASAGVFLTADCLSEEKREGTLGLLFLTNLKGVDVILGKMAGKSLRALTWFVSVIPFFVLPLVLGGVTPGEIGRVVGALLLTLAFSLAVGLLVSVLMEQAHESAMTTLAVLLVIGGLPLLLDWVWGGFISKPMPLSWLRFTSPLTSLLHAYHSSYGVQKWVYWNSFIGVGILTLTLLALASGSLKGVWRRETEGRRLCLSGRLSRRRPGNDEKPR